MFGYTTKKARRHDDMASVVFDSVSERLKEAAGEFPADSGARDVCERWGEAKDALHGRSRNPALLRLVTEDVVGILSAVGQSSAAADAASIGARLTHSWARPAEAAQERWRAHLPSTSSRRVIHDEGPHRFTWGNGCSTAGMALHADGISLWISHDGIEPRIFLSKSAAVQLRDQVRALTDDVTGDLWSREFYSTPDGSSLDVHSGPEVRVWLGVWDSPKAIGARHCLERVDAEIFAGTLERIVGQLATASA